MPIIYSSMKPSEALSKNRLAIIQIIASHRGSNPRVFGSTLTGNDTEGSDLDILIDPTPEMTLFDIAAILHELRLLLGIKVDIITPNSLPQHFQAKVIAEAKPI